MTIAVGPEPLDSDDARRLIAELNAYLSDLYPPEDNFFDLPVADVFLIARDDGEPIGCGAVRRLDADTAEIKRMYVAPRARGHGVGRTIIEQLEAFAVSVGVSRLVLETGLLQPSALALYQRAGFVMIPCFGEYAAAPNSRCYEKRVGYSNRSE